MNIVLMGHRCTGKTSVGILLADMLRLPFYDTDEMIRRRTGRTVAEIVQAGGWPAFRAAEKDAVRELAGIDGGVIALGGGTPLDPENAGILKKKGFFVWLSADLATLVQRIEAGRGDDGLRPPLTNGETREETEGLLKERIPVYRSLTDLTIETGDWTARRIAERIRAEMMHAMR